MKNLSDITACVVDHGLYIPLARHLAKTYKRVLYWSQWETGFPTLNDCIIGDGFPDIEKVEDIWPHKNEVDVWIFPDIYHSGLQKELVSQGKPVWGSREADTLETRREKFNRVLKDIGLSVPKFERILGLTNLRLFLNDKSDKFIKISRYRGSLETKKFRNMDVDKGLLDGWTVKFGPAADHIPFLVFDEIETNIELGADTYCVDGQFPDLMLNGLEAKDAGYLGAVTERDAMPDQIKEILDAWGLVLAPYQYRNNFSMEDRVSSDNHYFIDPTHRYPMPGTASMFTAFSNLPEIIYRGAQGELVQPIKQWDYVAECVMSMKCEKAEWGKMRFPDSLSENVQCSNCCQIDGAICWPPTEHHGNEIGWLVVHGNTVEEVIEEMKGIVGKLPDGVDCKTDALFDLLKEVREAEDKGIAFADEQVPEPETALNV